MEGMDKTMPKGDGLLVPHASSIKFGKPQFKQSTNLNSILGQIKENILQLNY
jgi:hypothetical protein